jgi:hypothetical protein
VPKSSSVYIAPGPLKAKRSSIQMIPCCAPGGLAIENKQSSRFVFCSFAFQTFCLFCLFFYRPLRRDRDRGCGSHTHTQKQKKRVGEVRQRQRLFCFATFCYATRPGYRIRLGRVREGGVFHRSSVPVGCIVRGGGGRVQFVFGTMDSNVQPHIHHAHVHETFYTVGGCGGSAHKRFSPEELL